MSTRPQLHERLKKAFKDTNFQFTSIESSLSQASKQFRADLRRTTLIADLEGDLGRSHCGDRRSATVGLCRRDHHLVRDARRGLRPWPSPAQRHRLAAGWTHRQKRSSRPASEHRARDGRSIMRPGPHAFRSYQRLEVWAPPRSRFRRLFCSPNDRAISIKTCLFDLNFHTGTVADYLDLKPVLDLGAIANRPERLGCQAARSNDRATPDRAWR